MLHDIQICYVFISYKLVHYIFVVALGGLDVGPATEEYKVDEQPRCDRCCQSGWQPRGKQSLQPGFIMYSAATGPVY